MSVPPDRDDELTPNPSDPEGDAESPSTASTPRNPDAEETVPALEVPADPESSWSTFLSPPKIDVTDESVLADVSATAPELEAQVRSAEQDLEATTDALDVKSVLDLFDHDDGEGSFRVRRTDEVSATQADLSVTETPAEPVADVGTPAAAPIETSGAGVESVIVSPVGTLFEASEPAISTAPARDFEDLTIAEMLGMMLRSPFATLRSLSAVARTPVERSVKIASAPVRFAPRYAAAGAGTLDAPAFYNISEETSQPERVDPPEEAVKSRGRDAARLALRVVAFILAWYGTFVMQSSVTRSEVDGLYVGLPFLTLGIVIWAVAEFIGGAARDRDTTPPKEADTAPEPEKRQSSFASVNDVLRRLPVAGLAVAASMLTVFWTRGNEFTIQGVIAWIISVILWVWVVSPTGWSPSRIPDMLVSALRSVGRFRLTPTVIAVIVIMLFGAFFRIRDLHLVPAEMTSDHVEMLRDTYGVALGNNNVFFSGNGGREPIQFYAFALFSSLPGRDLDFYNLKLLNALEGIISLPILFWFGRELAGDRNRKFGTLVGLLLAGMVAVSYWHEIISRIGERIVLTPIFISLILIFFMRALRDGRRRDWVLTGLALGIGLYSYQVIRIVPLILVFGTGLVFLAKLITDRKQLWQPVGGLVAAAIVAFAVYVPLFGFSLEYPGDYWRRTSGRLFGDEITQTTDENGNLIYRQATVGEQATAFQRNIPVLATNIRNALLMYNWKGDVSWFQNYPNQPAFDSISGGLLVVGVAAWAARLGRRRRAAEWAVPIAFFILILPSALSIAFPIENPSFTRMSGTLPIAYLVAAFALALIVQGLARLLGGVMGVLVGILAVVGLLAGSYLANSRVYFTDYNREYRISALPYSDAGAVMRSFAESGPGYGNVFIVSYPYWWDHRALGMAAGLLDYPHTIPSYEDIPLSLTNAASRIDRYRTNVDQDLLFYLSPLDFDGLARLRELFPSGYMQEMATSMPEDRYVLYRVPALGSVGFDLLRSLSQ